MTKLFLISLVASISTAQAQWANTFPSSYPPNYKDYWKFGTSTLGLTTDGTTLYVLANTGAAVAGAPSDRYQIATFDVASGNRTNAVTQAPDLFAVWGSKPGGRWANPGGFANTGTDLLTPGYWNSSGKTLDFGVADFSKSNLLLQPTQNLVLGVMNQTSQPFPDNLANAVVTSKSGVRYVLINNGKDVVVKFFANQAAMSTNTASVTKAMGLTNVTDVTSAVLDDVRNKLYFMVLTRSSSAFDPGRPSADTWTPILNQVDVSTTSFDSLSVPLRPINASESYPFTSDYPLITVLPPSGNVVVYAQTAENCGKYCTPQRAAVVARFDLTTGAMKWYRRLPGVNSINNLVSDVSGTTLLADWNALSAETGADVPGLPDLIMTPPPFNLNGSSIDPPVNNGTNNGTIVPPINNGTNNGTIVPPNNGTNNGTIIPPINNGTNGTIIPPINNGSNGTIVPPINNGTLVPPINNGTKPRNLTDNPFGILRRQQIMQPGVQQIIQDPSKPNSFFFTQSTGLYKEGFPTNWMSVGRVQIGGNITALPYVPLVTPNTTTTSTATTQTATGTSTATMTATKTATMTLTNSGAMKIPGLLFLLYLLI